MAGGLGVGFTSTLAVARYPQLRALALDLPLPALPVWLAVHREIRSSKRIRQVFDTLAQTLGELI